MTGIPLSPSAQGVLDTLVTEKRDGLIHVEQLLREITAQPPNRGAELIARLNLAPAENMPSEDMSVTRDSLLGISSREAERLGAYRIGCEHLVLALAELAAHREKPGQLAHVELPMARAELQALIAETAGRAYENLAPLPRGPQQARPFALVLAGLPGTGKSTLAERLARELSVPTFSLDWQLGALTPFGLVRPDNAVPLADHVLTAAMARQLQLGLGVVLDASGHLRNTRQRWRTVTEKLGARFVGVECTCSDEAVHRGRVDGRNRGIPGWLNTVSWDHVTRMRERWEPWEEPHLVLDSIEPIDDCVRRLVEVIRPGMVQGDGDEVS